MGYVFTPDDPRPDSEADWADVIATALINKYPYDERVRLRDGITDALREAYERGKRDGANG